VENNNKRYRHDVSSTYGLLLVFAAIGGQTLNAQDFVNGSLNGPTIPFSLAPPEWTNIDQGTIDTVDSSGHTFASIFSGIGAFPYGDSSNGGEFVYASGFDGTSPSQPEGLRQTVSGLSVGEELLIEFEFTNLALYDESGSVATDAFGVGQNLNSTGLWQIVVDGSIVGETPTVSPFAIPGTHAWSNYSQTFAASSSSHTFDFVSQFVAGPGTHVGLGIDGLRLTVVPEPSPCILSAIGWLYVVTIGSRRRVVQVGGQHSREAFAHVGWLSREEHSDLWRQSDHGAPR